jgi:undecaprenyl-diphosphatase
MTDFLIAIALGAVEGVTEFLPISSTGHLIILNRWLSFGPAFTATFDIVIQLGAICAVALLFRKRLMRLGIWKKVIVAVMPALVIGYVAGNFITAHLFNPFVVAIALIVGGIVLIISDKFNATPTVMVAEDMSFRQSFLVGLSQCLAFIPGMSRSASSIIGAQFLGASRTAAAEFSFFLAVPTILAASGHALLKGGISLTAHEVLLLAIGFSVSFLVAWGIIKTFLSYIQTKSFVLFGWYRIALGIVVLSFLWISSPAL